jgi:hypothetical protein
MMALAIPAGNSEDMKPKITPFLSKFWVLKDAFYMLKVDGVKFFVPMLYGFPF